MSDPQTQYDTSERVHWTVIRGTEKSHSVRLFGGDEEAEARADYENRRNTLRRGESIWIGRTVTTYAPVVGPWEVVGDE